MLGPMMSGPLDRFHTLPGGSKGEPAKNDESSVLRSALCRLSPASRPRNPFQIGHDVLDLAAMRDICRSGRKVVLSEAAKQRIIRSRAVVDELVSGGDAAPSAYGINTGFGFWPTCASPPSRSSSCSITWCVPTRLASDRCRRFRWCAGCCCCAPVPCRSGTVVRLLVAERPCELLNRQIHPLCPVAAPSVHRETWPARAPDPLVSSGKAKSRSGSAIGHSARPPHKRMTTKASPDCARRQRRTGAHQRTQCMTSIGMLAIADALELCTLADIIGAMSLEALLGTPRAFDPRIHAARPQPGQPLSAENLRKLLTDSPIVASHRNCGKVQDPYSLRCMP